MTMPKIDQALAEAEARFERTGGRLSKDCRLIYQRLLASPTPMKAYALLDGLSATGGRAAYPATVYRALTALGQAGLVHRIASLNAFAPCTAGEHAHAAAFMICDRCGGAEEAAAPSDHAAHAPAGSGFEVRSAVVELHGLCGRCAGGPPSG